MFDRRGSMKFGVVRCVGHKFVEMTYLEIFKGYSRIDHIMSEDIRN
jgi:hypothetical protein